MNGHGDGGCPSLESIMEKLDRAIVLLEKKLIASGAQETEKKEVRHHVAPGEVSVRRLKGFYDELLGEGRGE